MHPRRPGMHIAIDSLLVISSFRLNFFVCRHVSILGFRNRVCPYPENRICPSFVNISPTVVNNTWMEKSLKIGTTACMETQKLDFRFIKGWNWIFNCIFNLCFRHFDGRHLRRLFVRVWVSYCVYGEVWPNSVLPNLLSWGRNFLKYS